VEFQKLYVIDFNFNIFCGTPNDIWRRSSVPRRIVWEPLQSQAVVHNPGSTPPQGTSIHFQAGASPYVLCNMESLINKFINTVFV